jgi:hypothetical protein
MRTMTTDNRPGLGFTPVALPINRWLLNASVLQPTIRKISQSLQEGV